MRLLFRLPRPTLSSARQEIANFLKRSGGRRRDRWNGCSAASRRNGLRTISSRSRVPEDAPSVHAGQIGCVGFCFGGGCPSAWRAKAGFKRVWPTHRGEPVPIERVEKIDGPSLAFYGGDDMRINADIDKLVRRWRVQEGLRNADLSRASA